MSTSTSSLTPARKHRKLLKTPQGTEEVWSEAIEQVFVQGLRAYWASPFANSQGNKGRSRWRNQYLVDYLKKHGIERTKKQVASHIQVLRNMFKGRAEYHLVAGADELNELDSSSVKLEDHLDTTNLIAMEEEMSENSFQSTDMLHSPVSYMGDAYSPDSAASSLSSGSPRTMSSLPETPESFSSQLHPHQPTVHVAQSPLRHSHFHDLRHTPDDLLPKPSSNRITSFTLKAEGMTSFQVNLEALIPSPPAGSPPPVMIQTKLAVSPTGDARCPPAFQGFDGSVVVEKVWSSYACCFTRVFVGKSCLSEESDALEVSRIELGRVVASLPQSRLSQCRWLDPTLPTNVVQDIVIDGIAVFRVIYQLDRTNQCPYPSVELLRFAQAARPQQQLSVSASAPTSTGLYNLSSPTSVSPSYYPTSPTSPTDSQSVYPWSISSASVNAANNYGIAPIATTTSPLSF
ncbi:hypothetical protein DL96DRAFT_1597047 [Flagelloscypha sp. PMI_526]|nr:hypothetical protein DL96DRAFT_1597047 [Flagelloscypha sp. PMI_526]